MPPHVAGVRRGGPGKSKLASLIVKTRSGGRET